MRIVVFALFLSVCALQKKRVEERARDWIESKSANDRAYSTLSSRTPSEVLVFISPLRKDDNSVSRLLDVDMVTTLTTIFGVVKTF